MKAVYLEPRGSYRNELQSDTLFGLVCWAIRQVYSEERLVELLQSFAEGVPPFVLSSAFPYRNAEGKVYHFLPRPITMPATPAQQLRPTDAQERKAFKKARWILADDFARFADGQWDEQDYFASGNWKEVNVPDVTRVDRLRSTIDRLSSTTDGQGTLFTAPEYWVGDGGLYFMVRGEATDHVARALTFLDDFGWGGGNSIGHGHFKSHINDVDVIPEVAGANRFMTLSLYHPRADELDHHRSGDSFYELTTRKGKVGGHFLHARNFWKRSVMMFTPGSTFKVLAGRTHYGNNPIVKERGDDIPFDVQQLGYAFTAGMKVAGD